MSRINLGSPIMARVDVEQDSTLGLIFVREYLRRKLKEHPDSEDLTVVLERVIAELEERGRGAEMNCCPSSTQSPTRKSKTKSFLVCVPWNGCVDLVLTDSLGTLLCTHFELSNFSSGNDLYDLRRAINRRLWDEFGKGGKEEKAA